MTTTTGLSLEQFLKQPETKPASEYACGEVIQKPMPTQAHAILQRFLLVTLYHLLAKTGLGEVLPEWRCIFGPAGRERVFVPDLVVVSKERMPKGDARETPYLRSAPDLAIEILSPDQPVRPFLDKIVFYLQHGLWLIWIIDPATEVVLALRPGDDGVTLTTADQLDGEPVLPGFSLTLAELFAQLRP